MRANRGKPSSNKKPTDESSHLAESQNSLMIDRELDLARQREELKVKLLMLDASVGLSDLVMESLSMLDCAQIVKKEEKVGMFAATTLRLDGIECEIYRLRGKLSTRTNWFDYMDNVDAVVFGAALSDYDESNPDGSNKMVTALEQFRQTINHRAFAHVSTILLLHKRDVFAEKILHSDIASQRPFSDYAGSPTDFDQGVLYFIQKFKDASINDEFNDSFIYLAENNDKNCGEFIRDSLSTIIITDNLRRGETIKVDE